MQHRWITAGLFACALGSGCTEKGLQSVPPTLYATPNRLDFWLAGPGTQTKSIKIWADGRHFVRVSGITMTTPQNNVLQWEEPPNLPATVGDQDSITARVVFSASAYGDESAVIRIDSDAGTVEVPVTMHVGLVTDYPNIPACPDYRFHQPEVVWDWDGSTDPFAQSTATYSGIAVGNLSDDNDDDTIDVNDTPDVIFITWGGTTVLRSLSGATGEEQWSKEYALRAGGFPAIADLENDGVPEILVMGDVGASQGRLFALDNTGNLLWHGDEYEHEDNGDSMIQVADIDGNGEPEIVVGRTVFNRDGTLRWQGEGASGHFHFGSASFVTDLDGDGKSEIIAGTTTYNYDGTVRWDYPDLVEGPVAVADCDGDGKPEIFIRGVLVETATISILEHDGTIRVANKELDYDGLTPSLPAAADLNGDGVAQWIVSYHDKLAAIDCGGSVRWDVSIDDSSGGAGPAIFDFEGDEKYEIIFADEYWVYVIRDQGEVMFQAERASGTYFETPVIADINNDGHAEILVQNSIEFPSRPNVHRGLIAYANVEGDWAGAPRVWNQGNFVITNADESLAIPTNPIPHWEVANIFRGNFPICTPQ